MNQPPRPSRFTFFAGALVVALAAALAAAPLGATSFVMVRDESLVDRSPLVAEVVVDGRAAAPAGAATEYTMTIRRVLKGADPGSSIVVREPGGPAANGLVLKIWGAPQFKVGERALVFLAPRPDGTYRTIDLMLGAFHELEIGGRRLAVRNLAEARQLGGPSETLRDAAKFASWVEDRAAGRTRAADYQVAADPSTLGSVHDYFTLFADADGKNLRWFEFDTGGSVAWKAYNGGQPGVSGGGFTEFQRGLQAWNNDPATPINYTYSGTTSAHGGLVSNDGINEITFNDPNHELNAFNCTSGVLAYGGPWYAVALRSFHGKQYHAIAEGDIVTARNLSCFFSSSPNGSKAAEELFGHELGHTLGLGHSCGDSDSPPCGSSALYNDALMRAIIHDDGRGARLNADDKAGIAALYAQSSAPAAPTGLAAQAVSTSVIHLTWTDNATNESEYRIEERRIDESTFVPIGAVAANSTSAQVPNLDPATAYVFRVRANSASAGYSAYSNEAAAATLADVGACVASGQNACLASSRFKVYLSWVYPSSQTGSGQLAPLSSANAAVFYFDNPDDWQLLIKAIDGCALNNHYWVFWAATTNVQLTITVVDTQTGAVHVYFNPQGTAAPPVQDTSAFATCP
ncbi:MAG: fibronectin type III domain-containing protein [Acidobacteriota bacterium]